MSNHMLMIVFIALYLLRALYFGASIGDALFMGFLCTLYSFHSYLKTTDQQNINDDVRKELDTMKSSIDSLKARYILPTKK